MDKTRSLIKAQIKLMKELGRNIDILREEILSELNINDLNKKEIESIGFFITSKPRSDMTDVLDNIMDRLDKANALYNIPDGEKVNLPSLKVQYMGQIIEATCPVGDGKLVATLSAIGTCDNSVQSWASYYAPNGASIDLALAEVKKGELAECSGLPEDNQDIDLYIWRNPFMDDYTDKIQISHKDIVEASKIL